MDKKSFSTFKKGLESHLKDLQRYSRAYYYDQSHTNDLVQETILRALEKQDQFHIGTNLKGWLFKIMRNIYLNDYKHRTKFKNVDINDCPLSKDPHQEESLYFHEVQDAFDDLPLHERKILYLAAVDGLSYDEIADNLKIKPGTVKSRINRARLDLQEKFKSTHYNKRTKKNTYTLYHLPSLS